MKPLNFILALFFLIFSIQYSFSQCPPNALPVFDGSTWQFGPVANCDLEPGTITITGIGGTEDYNSLACMPPGGSVVRYQSLGMPIGLPATVTYGGLTCEYNASGALLPVEWLSFEVTKTNKQVLVSWSTATEIDNKGFEVQVSQDGINFKELAFIKGAGNSLEINTYQYDFSPKQNGLYYFRVKQIDFDGTHSFTNIISIDFSDGEPVAIRSLFPNPTTSGELFLEIYAKKENIAHVAISNSLGQRVEELHFDLEKGIHQKNLNLRNLPMGIYFLELSVNQTRIIKKIFINNF